MVELIAAAPEDRALLDQRMRPLLDGQPAPWIVEAVSSGRFNIDTIVLKGVKVGCFWWWYSEHNKALVINAGASFVNHDTFDCFMAAFHILAKRLGATSIETQSSRLGVIRKYRRRAGFKVEAVCLRKLL